MTVRTPVIIKGVMVCVDEWEPDRRRKLCQLVREEEVKLKGEDQKESGMTQEYKSKYRTEKKKTYRDLLSHRAPIRNLEKNTDG